jgi:hypothetical protein
MESPNVRRWKAGLLDPSTSRGRSIIIYERIIICISIDIVWNKKALGEKKYILAPPPQI